jgi:hypothetical protein
VELAGTFREGSAEFVKDDPRFIVINHGPLFSKRLLEYMALNTPVNHLTRSRFGSRRSVNCQGPQRRRGRGLRLKPVVMEKLQSAFSYCWSIDAVFDVVAVALTFLAP